MEALATVSVDCALQTPAEKLEKILIGAHIKPVYQPIVSLIDGQIYGYEALSRISNATLAMDIEEMFRLADRTGKAWDLETLCRMKSLENSIHMDPGKKLFLNVNSNIIHDTEFRQGITKKHLGHYGLDADNVIFEITERVAVLDNKAFLESIRHYKSQRYGIAIDDVGSGYSGLNIIASVKPDIMKIDMALIRNIDNDETKQLLCKAIVDFGKNAGIQTVGEGIETEDELKTLIQIGVDYGQGYFLGIPQAAFEDIQPEKKAIIQKYHLKKYNEHVVNAVWPAIGHLAKPGKSFSEYESSDSIHEALRLNPTVTEFAVVHEGVAVGILARSSLDEIWYGNDRYSLYVRKTLQKAIRRDCLRVNFSMPVNQVAQFAMQRPFERLYDPVIVEKNSRYFGIVTIKDLLGACAKTATEIALRCNPLTGLPGNLLIEHEIAGRLFRDAPYCVTYYDIDNFKAYNDAYGFHNGDKMLQLLADILKKSATKNEFIGHMGGDDFIVICDYHSGEAYCHEVLHAFNAEVPSLYRPLDSKNGYIVSKNRNGVTEKFPITSLSIAGVSNRTSSYKSLSHFSEKVAERKKECKMRGGNCIAIV